jgi:hypothetical protein
LLTLCLVPWWWGAKQKTSSKPTVLFHSTTSAQGIAQFYHKIWVDYIIFFEMILKGKSYFSLQLAGFGATLKEQELEMAVGLDHHQIWSHQGEKSLPP